MKTKKLIAILVTALFALNIFAVAALADTAPTVTVTSANSTTTTTDVGTVTAPDSGLTPDSPLYGLKVLSEKVNLLLTDDPQKQAALYAQYAMERLNEAQYLTGLSDQQKADLLQKLTQQYTADIQKAQELLKQALAAGANIKELVVKVDQAQNIAGLKIVLANLPEDMQKEIELNLLKNAEDLSEIKLILTKNGIEIDEENEKDNDAMEAILGQSMKNFVHAVNDARKAVHKSTEDKENLKTIEQQFKVELRQISQRVKSQMVEIAQKGGTAAELDAVAQQGITDVNAAKDKALAALNNPASPQASVQSADETQAVPEKEADQEHGNNKMMNKNHYQEKAMEGSKSAEHKNKVEKDEQND